MTNATGAGAFATPAWMLERVAIDLIVRGSTTHAWLGLIAETSTEHRVAVVRSVVAGSPAAAAGLRPGDLLDEADGEPITTAEALWTHVHTSRPGDDLVLAVTRAGGRRLMTATLATLAPPAG
jgi:S1-C subfamily serine protease